LLLLLLLVLLVVLRRLVEVGAQAVGARGPRGIWLLLLLVRGGRPSLGDLLRRSLALGGSLLAVCGLEALHALVVYCQRWSVSRTHAQTGGPTACSLT
jgi:hypothetical protein